MIKRFNEFINEGWAAGSIRRASGGNMRKEEMPKTKKELQDMIIKRMESEGNECDLNDIDVSRIRNMSSLFCADPKKGNAIFKEFKGDISGWDVSNVIDMGNMFYGCENFNGDISGWDVSGVEYMTNMFLGCKNFNQDISGWDVSGVKLMNGMFRDCRNFNQDLSGWNISNMKTMYYMFYGCPEKPEWYEKTKYGIQEIIYDRIKDEGPECDLNDIDVSGISDMSCMFCDNYDYDGDDPVFKYFNGDVSGWDVSGVKNMNAMFYGCENFNRDLNSWDVSNVEDMSYMFFECTDFNGDISGWKVSNVENMNCMFCNCEKFNRDLSNWDVSNAETMEYMFAGCEKFNKDLSGWEMPKVKTMECMFLGCAGFRNAGKLESWGNKIINCKNTKNMFKGCPSMPSWYKQ